MGWKVAAAVFALTTLYASRRRNAQAEYSLALHRVMLDSLHQSRKKAVIVERKRKGFSSSMLAWDITGLVIGIVLGLAIFGGIDSGRDGALGYPTNPKAKANVCKNIKNPHYYTRYCGNKRPGSYPIPTPTYPGVVPMPVRS